jgi:hypothetical protein
VQVPGTLGSPGCGGVGLELGDGEAEADALRLALGLGLDVPALSVHSFVALLSQLFCTTRVPAEVPLPEAFMHLAALTLMSW